jgi:hypothetical protein
MTSLLNPAQQDVLATLRGERNDRPVIRREFRSELQAELELALRDVEGPLTVDKSSLTKVHQCEGRLVALDEFQWNPSNAKGTIAHKAIELSCGGVKQVTPAKLVESAMQRICESPDTRSLAEYIRNVGDEERAELRVSATDIYIKFAEMFPPLSSNWIPNAEATTAAYIGQRRIVFRGKIDLKLGSPIGDRANTLIIDVKSGNPSFTDMEDLRFYALLETLRTGLPPFRWANAYVSAGRIESEDFTEDTIWSAAKRLADGTRKISRIKEGTTPQLTPGNACRFCPAQQTCVAAAEFN